MPIHNPKNPARIDTIYAFMSIDEDGCNGIVGGILPGVGGIPLVTGSPALAEHYKSMAEEYAKATGKKVGLFAFKREDGILWESKP